MKKSELSDTALSQLLFESQVTVEKLSTAPESVFQRLQKFSEFYQSLAEKPESAALLYQERGARSVGCVPIREKLVVGRLSKSARNPQGCDLTFKDAEISRVHFEVECRDGLFVLRDLQSRNGTLVNGNPAAAAEVILKGGDLILAAGVIFVFTGA